VDNPLVSVIVPAFNAEANIRQTLNSVLSQTYQAIEAIVVDDGSSDATCSIVEEFVTRDLRFQLVRQSNAGVGAARNTAIRRARGKYIAPLDADDMWFPEKLERQVACMERYGNETGLVYCWSALIDKRGELKGKSYAYTVEGRLRHALVLRNFVENASVPLFRTTALEKVGLYLTRAEQGGVQGCEDWDLSLRIAEIYNIRVVLEYLVAYRLNSSSMSNQFEGMAKSFQLVVRRARQRNCDLPSASFRWSGGYFYLYLAHKCYNRARYSDCLRYLKEATWTNAVLLLKAEVYRKFVVSVFCLITRSTRVRLDEPGQLSPVQKMGAGGNLHSKERRKRPFILNVIFKHFENVRWSAALDDGT
jgi:glycosyltransferase involved in cell wall biosynthesis